MPCIWNNLTGAVETLQERYARESAIDEILELEHQQRRSEVEKCIDCDNKAYTRGLCVNSYQKALRAIKSGKTTWQEMEQKGKCKINRKSKYTNANSNETVNDDAP